MEKSKSYMSELIIVVILLLIFNYHINCRKETLVSKPTEKELVDYEKQIKENSHLFTQKVGGYTDSKKIMPWIDISVYERLRSGKSIRDALGY